MMRTFRLMYAALREQARAEKAFLGNFWFGLSSRLLYNVMFILFIDVLFRRVGNIAGYSHNDFLFMYFVAQVSFYITYTVINQAMQRVLLTVRTGNLDLLLLKPVPHRSFLYISGMNPVDLSFTLITTLPLVGSQIDWGALHLTAGPVAIASLVWVCGVIICNTLMFALILPAFKAGDATDSLNVFFSITTTSSIPYSKMPFVMKAMSLTLLPHLVMTGASAEIMLQKGDTMSVVIPVLIATAASALLYQVMWRWSLRNYTSASS